MKKKKQNTLVIIIKDRAWWHIRKYYKSGHGALIVGESGEKSDDDYYFFNITRNPPIGYSYFETSKPINKGDQKSHIRLYLQRGKKKRFSRWVMSFELSKKDYDIIERYLSDKKKKR